MSLLLALLGITPTTFGVLKYWNGATWIEKPLKRWNGTTWETKTLKLWNGSTWG